MATMGRWRLVWILGAVALTAGCGDDDDLGPPRYEGPDAPGPFHVGVTEMEIDDGRGAGRVLPITVWYPVSPVDADASAEDDPFTYGLGVTAGVYLVEEASPMEAVADVPADPRGPFPIVLFSHGNGGVRQQSFFMTEWLASHGFIVAAPDHVGNTILDELTGTSIPTVEAALLRPTDMSRTLDAVYQASDDPGSPLAGAADDVRVGITGHSFGGFTSFRVAGATIDQELHEEECEATEGGLLCDDLDELSIPANQQDERVLAAMPQAPGGAMAMLPSGGFADVSVPTFIQAGDVDLTTPLEAESEAPYEQLTVPASLLVIGDAGHFTFSDMCRFLEGADPSVLELIEDDVADIIDDGCGEANLPWPRAHEIINAYAADFFHWMVAGTDGFGTWTVPEHDHPPEVVRFDER